MKTLMLHLGHSSEALGIRGKIDLIYALEVILSAVK